MKILTSIAALVLGGFLVAAIPAGAAPHREPGGAINGLLANSTNGSSGTDTNSPPICSTNQPPATNTPPTLNTNAATALAARAAVLYAAVAPFDTNADGSLNADEQTALFEALTNGTVAIFGTNEPGVFPPHDGTNVTLWIAMLYTTIATFDADHDGELDDAEQAALEADTVSLPLFAPLTAGGRKHASANTHAPANARRKVWRPINVEAAAEARLTPPLDGFNGMAGQSA